MRYRTGAVVGFGLGVTPATVAILVIAYFCAAGSLRTTAPPFITNWTF